MQFESLPPWLHRVIKTVLRVVGALALVGLVIVLVLALSLTLAYPHLPEISGLMDYRPKQPMRVYSADNILIGEFGEERRNFTPIRQIPQVMQEAVLAAEDARFFTHGGVDYVGVLRAGWANFGGYKRQGASTITMQVARNFYLSTEKTFTRKIYEILLALKIESMMSKNQILEAYMNQIFLGQRAYGFTSACEIYFGKRLRDISIAEAAMLAGLPKAPSLFNPISNPKRAELRQKYIIDRMLENKYITKEQHAQAKSEVLRYRTQSVLPAHAEYVAETARALIFNQYGEESYTRGLNVYLTLNSADQMVAYRALRKGIMDYEKRQYYRGPEAYITLPTERSEWDERISEALQDHPDNDELKAAVAIEANLKKVVAVMQNGERITITGDGLRPVMSGLSGKGNPTVQIRPGAVIRLLQADKKSEWSITQQPEVEGAFVALDPNTGAIKSLVGGFDYSKSKFNHVTQAWRQPGSSFKPFIYSAALEKGFTPTTTVNDAPLFFGSNVTGGKPWEPKNYDGEFEGPMTVRRALAKSKNMVSIRILQSITPAFAQDWITQFGFDKSRHLPYLTMALGAGSVTPMQMATGFGVFANGGYFRKPLLIQKVTDDKGTVLTEVLPTELSSANRVIEARNAFVMTSLLQEVTRSGTAAKAQAILKRPDIFGKTGTTNDSMDAWFAGYHPNLVAVVWIGYDNPRKLGDRETGGGLALPVWIDYMKYALQNEPITDVSAPEGLVNLNGEWYFEEYTRGSGIGSVGLNDEVPSAPTEEEKNSILDLFRN
jgi:penicillin-binding protein 1A